MDESETQKAQDELNAEGFANGPYIKVYGNSVCLDGDFTLDELNRLVEILKRHVAPVLSE